ncbi:MAG: WD40/YVTN/BNR-like repeat-containing protein [Bacillota bacterium]
MTSLQNVSRSHLALALCIVILSIALTACAPRVDNLVEGVSVPGVTIKMVDQKTGWALRGARVLRTTDGGRNWTDVGPEDSLHPEGADAAFLDSTHAWLAVKPAGADQSTSGLRVYRTSDAGESWDSTELPNATVVGRFSFLNENEGWLTLHQGAAMHSEQVTILATTDGGKTWSEVSTVSPDPQPGELPFSGNKSGLAFSNSSNGFLTGYWPVPGSPYLFSSTDGGRTWAQMELALPEGYEEADCSTHTPVFYGEGAGTLPVTLYAPAGEREILFYSTMDGGKTWTPGTPIATGEESASWDAPKPGMILVAAQGKLHISTDGGKTWSTVTPNIDFEPDGPLMLSFVSEKTGWALVNGKLMKTTDGGVTWSRT